MTHNTGNGSPVDMDDTKFHCPIMRLFENVEFERKSEGEAFPWQSMLEKSEK